MSADFEESDDGSLFVVASGSKFLLKIWVGGCKNYPEEFIVPRYAYVGLGICEVRILNPYEPDELWLPIIRMSKQLKLLLNLCNKQPYTDDTLDDIALCICHSGGHDEVDTVDILRGVLELMERCLLQRIDSKDGWTGFYILLVCSRVSINSHEWNTAKGYFRRGKNVPDNLQRYMT